MPDAANAQVGLQLTSPELKKMRRCLFCHYPLSMDTRQGLRYTNGKQLHFAGFMIPGSNEIVCAVDQGVTEERVVELIMAKAAEFQTKEEKVIETTWMQWFGNAFHIVW